MALGKNIRAFRLRREWDLPTLAEKSGVDVGTISALEMRNSKRSQFITQLADAFGVTAQQLVSGEDAPGKKPDADLLLPQLSPLAVDIAVKWMALSEDRQDWFRDLIFSMHFMEKRFPAMRKGRPRGEKYEALERSIERDMKQLSMKFD